MPYSPIMHITFTEYFIRMLLLVPGQISKRRRWPVRYTVGSSFHCIWQNIMEHSLIVIPNPIANFRGVWSFLFPAPSRILYILGPSRIDLIISAPQRNTRMIAQTLDIIFRLHGDTVQKRLISGIHAAGKHKILPD
ncbi:hypothetical protein D3C80_1600910 [compost metagenome]